uniref:RNase H type-1 domain-containing protein n=1 Tax=Panagrolaimus sp. JU765 TaxID=591449 RepID=A0AC34Q985_9BILA
MEVPVYIHGMCLEQEKSKEAHGCYGVYWREDSPANFADYVLFDATEHRAELYAVIRALQLAVVHHVRRIRIHSKFEYLAEVLPKLDDIAAQNWADENGDPIENQDLLERIYDLKSRVDFTIELPTTESDGMQKARGLAKNISTFFSKMIHA